MAEKEQLYKVEEFHFDSSRNITRYMTLEEINSLAYKYLGDSDKENGIVFTSEREIEEMIEFIYFNGDDTWSIYKNDITLIEITCYNE